MMTTITGIMEWVLENIAGFRHCNFLSLLELPLLSGVELPDLSNG